MEYILNWLDLAWVPVALIALHKGQRIKSVLFILSCMLTLRLQVDLMRDINYPNGVFNLLDIPLLHRGFLVYGVFIAIFLILSHISREKDPYIFIAASISVFTAAFCVSTLVLVL